MKYEGTYIIWGPPGTGKTSFLSEQVKAILNESQSLPLVCSLTRTAATEIAGRIELPRENVGTLHSLAYRALDRPDIAETQIEDWNDVNPRLKIDVKDKSLEDEPGYEFKAQTPGNELLQEYQLYRARQIPRNRWKESVKSFAREWEYWKNELGVIDFTDMIERAINEFGNRPPGDPGVIIADEVQDHSALEYELLCKWGAAAGCLMVSGDPWQALYVWRGAHPELFMDPEIPEDHRRVLHKSYRIPGSVYRTAMAWSRELSTWTDLKFAPRKEQGKVERRSVTWKAPESLIKVVEDELKADRTIMILGSCSFILGPMLNVLRKAGIPFSNPWRLRRGDWNPLTGSGIQMKDRLVDFLQIEDRNWTARELWSWSDPIKAKGTLERGVKKCLDEWKHPEQIIEEQQWREWITDEALIDLDEAIANRQTGSSIDEIISWWFKRLLSTKKRAAIFPVEVCKRRGIEALTGDPRCYIGTIHSFKGAEADTVILFPDLSPAGWRTWNGGLKVRDSVVRMFYVGMTRAKQRLILCEPASIRSAPIGEAMRT